MAQLPQTVFPRVIVGVVVLQLLLSLSEARIAKIISQHNGLPYATSDEATQGPEHSELEVTHDNMECEHAKRGYREGFLVANVTATLLRQQVSEQNFWMEQQRSQLKACLAREVEMRHMFQQCYLATPRNLPAAVSSSFEEKKQLYQKETIELQNKNDDLQNIISSKDQMCMDLLNLQCKTTCQEITSVRASRNLKTVETAKMYANLINKLTKCVGDNNIHVLKLMDEKDSVMTELGQSLITEARLGHVENVKSLIDAGVSVSVSDSDGWTPLLYATQQNRVSVVKLLLQSGADPNTKNRRGDTTLVWAAHHNNVEMAKMLREKGAKLDYNDGETALHFAAFRGGVDIIRYFLSIGADINAMDNYGMTPLAFAIQKNKPDLAQFLRSQGATTQ